MVPLALGTLTTGNERASNLAAHLGEFADIGMSWKTNGAANQWVRGDFGSAKAVDFIGMIAANATPGATTIRIRLGDTQAKVDGTADYDSGVIPFVNPVISREDGLYHTHIELPAVQTRRWWRIDINHAAGDFEAATLVLGQKVTPSTYYNSGWQFGGEDLGEIEIGRWGVADENPGLIFRTLAFKLGWLSEVDFETKMRPLIEKLGKRRVALWCFDPTPNAYRQTKTYLGWLRNSPTATGGILGGRYESEFEILSMV